MPRETCYSCPYYNPTRNKETGTCTFLDDFAGPSYQVNPERGNCIYNLNPRPRQLSQSKARARDKQQEERRKARADFARKIAEEVARWPKEKRRACYGQIKSNS